MSGENVYFYMPVCCESPCRKWHALPALGDAPVCSCSGGREGMWQDASRTGTGRTSQPPASSDGGVSRTPARCSCGFCVHHGSGKNHRHTAARRIQPPSIQLFLWVGMGMEGWGGDAGNRRLAGENQIIHTTLSVTRKTKKPRQLPNVSVN